MMHSFARKVARAGLIDKRRNFFRCLRDSAQRGLINSVSRQKRKSTANIAQTLIAAVRGLWAAAMPFALSPR